MSSYTQESEKDRIKPLRGTEDYFLWAQLMEIRLGKNEAWKPIVTEPPVNRGRDEAPIVVEDFQEQYEQLGLPEEDTTRWNKRRWEIAYAHFKQDIKKYNEWQKKELFARSEIMERLSPHVQKEVGVQTNARALWNALKKRYSVPLITEQLKAFQELMRIDRSAYPDVRRYTTAMNSAFNHLTHNLRFNLAPEFLSMHYLYKEASNSASDWSKFLDKHRTGTVLDAPEDICTTLHGLEDQSSKAKKPAAAPVSVNVLQGKKRRNDSQGGRQSKQQKKGPTCSECNNSHSLNEGQVCWFKHPDKAPESWQKRHPDLLTK
ncbi:hypothetical protein GJ744_004325 [Endocarpon pusillum]|uniref:DUF4219 domain-containing protein n=1 Tax=Endocarpon pusillum TaxID=364733 RepID=A0A8H7A6L3_9EURO|nr:hypothetical protein GJ744_004325 [Endocarpon pusillum]